MVTGSCLCGGIKFEIAGQLNKVQLCHCQQCRKAQGAPFAANIPVDAERFHIVKGTELLKEFKSKTREGKYRVFCFDCGSPIMSRLDSAPHVVRVRAGTLDGPLSLVLAWHQYVDQKASWWFIDDHLPQHDTKPED